MTKIIGGKLILQSGRLDQEVIRFPVSKIRSIKQAPDRKDACVVELWNGHEYMVDESKQDLERWQEEYFDEREAEYGGPMRRL